METTPALIEVIEPMELKHASPIYFKAGNGSSKRFFFQLDDNKVVKVRAWSLHGNAYPDLYMNVNKEDCTVDSSDWKSNFGSDNEIIVYPEDQKLQ